MSGGFELGIKMRIPVGNIVGHKVRQERQGKGNTGVGDGGGDGRADDGVGKFEHVL